MGGLLSIFKRAEDGVMLATANAKYRIATQKEHGSSDPLGAGILEDVYGKGGLLYSMIFISRDPADPGAYNGLVFKQSDIQRLYDTMIKKRLENFPSAPTPSYSAFELPSGTVDSLGSLARRKYEEILEKREQNKSEVGVGSGTTAPAFSKN